MARANLGDSCDDVPTVSRNGRLALPRVAKDFGISEGTLSN